MNNMWDVIPMALWWNVITKREWITPGIFGTYRLCLFHLELQQDCGSIFTVIKILWDINEATVKKVSNLE